MESIRTLYRFFVMAATIAIVAMGWRLYGPPTAECKKFAARGVEVAQNWLSGKAQPEQQNRTAPPRLQPMSPALVKVSQSAQDAPPLFAGEATLPPSRPEVASVVSPDESLPLSASASQLTPAGEPERFAADSRDQLSQLFAELAELDVEEPQLSPWGKSGRLFRFCCRASLPQSPDFTRHFESIAEDPHEAMEQVLAQVSAWRAAPLASR